MSLKLNFFYDAHATDEVISAFLLSAELNLPIIMAGVSGKRQQLQSQQLSHQAA